MLDLFRRAAVCTVCTYNMRRSSCGGNKCARPSCLTMTTGGKLCTAADLLTVGRRNKMGENFPALVHYRWVQTQKRAITLHYGIWSTLRKQTHGALSRWASTCYLTIHWPRHGIGHATRGLSQVTSRKTHSIGRGPCGSFKALPHFSRAFASFKPMRRRPRTSQGLVMHFRRWELGWESLL